MITLDHPLFCLHSFEITRREALKNVPWYHENSSDYAGSRLKTNLTAIKKL